MKMKQLFFVGLMGIAFAGCSGDNAYDNGDPIEGDQFMAVKLVMSGDAASTRAFGSAGFEAGTEDEVGVTNATFLFFDGENQVADPFTTTDLGSWTAVSGTNQSVDKQATPIIVLSNAIKNPTSIVAILNPSTGITITRSTTLTQLQAIKNDYSQYTTASKFVMSNSVYNKNGKNVIGAPCTAANVQKTQELAKQNPVKIAVEKVVAKVHVEQASGMKVETNPTEHNNNVTVDGASKEITAEITGWWLDNTNSTSFLIKKLETSYPTPIGDTNWWNDETNYRSYWATPADGTLTHYAYNTAKQLTNDRYCLENTKQETPTQIVVAATLKTGGTAVDLVKYLSVLYTKSGFEDELTKLLSNKYYTQTGSNYTPLTKDKLTFAYNAAAAGTKPYEAEVTVALQGTVSVFTTTDGSNYTSADAAISTDLANLKRTVQYWKDGKTYYYLPIVHNGDITITSSTTIPATPEHKLYGIVRNHLYKLSIKSINGLGTPVPNPEDPTPITPEKPEDDNSYIAAQIEILKYKVVTQDVDLGL